MTWQPNPDGLNQICTILSNTTSPDNAVQQQNQQQLEQCKAIPDFCNYLVYCFAKLPAEQAVLRQVAGLLLKNMLKDLLLTMDGANLAYIKQCVVETLGDPQHTLRQTCAVIITTIVVTAKSLSVWPDLFDVLGPALDSPDQNKVDGALNTFELLFEDTGDMIEDHPQKPLNQLVPKFIAFFKNPNENFRRHALSCMCSFILLMPEALRTHMKDYVEGLYFLTQDTTTEVRKRVCESLVLLCEICPEVILGNIRDCIVFFLSASQDEDEIVAREATEFWSAFCEADTPKEALVEFLPTLVPLLLKNMAYSEDEVFALIGDGEDDAHVADRPEEIKPWFHHSKMHGSGEDDDEFDGKDEVQEWTLRKCSAAGLDIISNNYNQDILNFVLPVVSQNLQSPEWKTREASILALGAIAEGCFDGVEPHLPQLVPFLIQLLSDEQPLIRSISCWTLSRYSSWICAQQPESTYLTPLMQELLKRVLDRNKKVQEAGCSAFATLEEEAQEHLVPYLGDILKVLMQAFQTYQQKNMQILFDAIGTLADSVGSHLNKPEYVQIIMPPLMQKWNSLPDGDKGLLSLFECLTAVIQALGVGFQPYAQSVFGRVLNLTQMSLQAFMNSPDAMQTYEYRELLVSSLDLFSGMCEGLGASIEGLIAGTQLPQILLACLRTTEMDIHQSSLALIGDLAKRAIVHIQPHLNEMIPLMMQFVPNYSNVSVSNNAIWAIGEVAIKVKGEFAPLVPSLLQMLTPLMCNPNLHSSLRENTAITIGRLGMVCPKEVAPELGKFVQPWLLALAQIKDIAEKEDSFRGLCSLIKLNPQAVMYSFIHLADAIASWDNPSPDMKESFKQILQGMAQSLGAQWQAFFATFPPELKNKLQQQYGL